MKKSLIKPTEVGFVCVTPALRMKANIAQLHIESIQLNPQILVANCFLFANYKIYAYAIAYSTW
ncbi:hypothetical protein FDUTEX481_06185 [Tolypothrix sp. PCC 7601]|nr:hypothetical protein FDUTEX481_06185 [Tolypothrix sp. PCC 7601]